MEIKDELEAYFAWRRRWRRTRTLTYSVEDEGKDVAEPRQYGQAVLRATHVVGRCACGGKMHDDLWHLRKSAKDSTLEHSLFAAFNTE